MSSLITPRNTSTGGVQIPAADPNARQMHMPGGGLQAPQDPLYALRSMFQGGQGQVGGGVSWERYDSPGYDDPALREIAASGSQMDENSTQYYIQRVSQPMALFLQQCLSRSGMFYTWYQQTVETFKLDANGSPDQICAQFVEFFQKRPEITPIVARNASVVFGYECMTRLKQGNLDNLDARNYGQSAEVAVRFILFLEMVSWLVKSQQGRSLIYNLSPSLKARIDNLPKLKEFAQTVFQQFNLPFPYENLTFEAKIPTAMGQQLMPAVAAMYGPDYGVADQHDQTVVGTEYREVSNGRGGMVSIDEQSRLNALCYKLDLPSHDDVLRFEKSIGGYRLNPLNQHDMNKAIALRNQQLSQTDQPVITAAPVIPNYVDTYNDTYAIRDLRTDFANIRQHNRSEFDWAAPFTYTDKEGVYLIKEELWKNIKQALRPADPTDMEESVWGSFCYRVVEINLKHPDKDGYRSYVIRDKARRFTQMQVFTDPKACLPVLEADESGQVVVANSVNVSDVIPEKDLASFIIPAEEVKKLDGTIPVISNPDAVISNNHNTIKQTVEMINNRLTSELKNINATSMDVGALEEFLCKDQNTKARLVEVLPFLFENHYGDIVKRSYAETISYIAKTFRFESLDEELVNFIRYKLTKDFNDFLINNAGFSPDVGHAHHLSTSDVLADIDDLMELFEKNDQMLYDYLSSRDHRTPLGRKMCMFTLPETEYEEREVITTNEDTGEEIKEMQTLPVKLSPMEQLKQDTTLDVCNRIHMVTINKTPSPMHTDNTTVVIKRSKFPEIFAMIEGGFEKTFAGSDVEFGEVDKLVRFSNNDDLWLFSKSVYDENTGILRHVPNSTDLFMLEYN